MIKFHIGLSEASSACDYICDKLNVDAEPHRAKFYRLYKGVELAAVLLEDAELCSIGYTYDFGDTRVLIYFYPGANFSIVVK